LIGFVLGFVRCCRIA